MMFRRLLIAGLIVVAFLTWFQRKLMYPAMRAESLETAQFPVLRQFFQQAEDIELLTPDGVRIRGWRLQAESSPAEHVLLLFHGNGGHRAHRAFWYEVARSLNMDVIAIDYHGYGDSEGSPSEKALIQDAAATWDYAVAKCGYQPSQIVIAGESLGGAVGVRLAAEQCRNGTAPGGLVLVATFDSMLRTASWHYPFLPVRWLLLDRYHSDRHIPDVSCPILQVHGTNDTIVPLEFARNLFMTAPDQSAGGTQKSFLEIPDAGHNDLLSDHARTIRDAMAEMLKSRENVR